MPDMLLGWNLPSMCCTLWLPWPWFSYGGGILGVSEKAAGISFKLLTDPISCTTLSMEAAQEAFS